MNKPRYVLSIRQPWAWLICKGFKDIENRDWPLSPFRKGKRIYVHAGRIADDEAMDILSNEGWPQLTDSQHLEALGASMILGAIIGEVTIIDCVTKSKSPWFVGNYGFVLTDPMLYKKPIFCRGQLGFFKPEVIHDL